MKTFRKAIYALISMETKGEALPMAAQQPNTPGGGSKSKPLKKDDQYRIMFSELEKFLTKHTRSERHIKVAEGIST